jgi:hypothetical protein
LIGAAADLAAAIASEAVDLVAGDLAASVAAVEDSEAGDEN